jgi:hypothetical protein
MGYGTSLLRGLKRPAFGDECTHPRCPAEDVGHAQFPRERAGILDSIPLRGERVDRIRRFHQPGRDG